MENLIIYIYNYYTCQLFLRYKREIFILGVLGFLQTTRSFPKIPEAIRSLPKTSEVCRRRSYRENAYPQNQRSRERYCYLFIYTWFSFLTWVWVNIFLEIVSSRTATTHIFQPGVRNWPAGVSRHAWDQSFQPAGVRVGRYKLFRQITKFCSRDQGPIDVNTDKQTPLGNRKGEPYVTGPGVHGNDLHWLSHFPY